MTWFVDAAGYVPSQPAAPAADRSPDQAVPVSTSIIQLMRLPAKEVLSQQNMCAALARQQEVFLACGVPCKNHFAVYNSLHGSIRNLQDGIGNTGAQLLWLLQCPCLLPFTISNILA